jgi:hypothetical protein
MEATSSGEFATVGDAQSMSFHMRASETHGDNTYRNLYIDESSEQPVIPANTCWHIDVHMVGITQNAAKQWAYNLGGILERDNANNTTLAAATPAVETLFESVATFNPQLLADDTNEALLLQIRDTAGGGDVVRWVAEVHITSVTYP